MYKWYLPTLSEILTLTESDRLRSTASSCQTDDQIQGQATGQINGQINHPIVGQVASQSGQKPSSTRPDSRSGQNRSLAQHRLKAEREWTGAVAALNHLMQQGLEAEAQTLNGSGSDSTPPVLGLVLSGPFPILQSEVSNDQIASWVFTVGATAEVLQLLPAAEGTATPWKSVPTLPLRSDDPLAAEQFCLALTPEFSLVMVLGESAGTPAFSFSFEPEVIWQVWRSLQARLQLTAPQLAIAVNRMVEQFTPVVPSYQTVVQFSRLMLANLPEPAEWGGRSYFATPMPSEPTSESTKPEVDLPHIAAETETEPAKPCADTELLQALAHEVRTPLTTIRTLTRLLLKRKDLNPDVLKRLEIIDRECTEQIDRFSLIFRAVELQTTESKSALMPLAPISLAQVIQQNIKRWQQQASQHSHTLDILLPQKLPMVVTDPTMLDQALTGLIDRITHRLPPGSHIQVQVTPAGPQLKLQFVSQPQPKAQYCGGKGNSAHLGFMPAVRSIGQLLMFQPETGNLSLNMAVTKNLFQALGGKLIVREHPEAGEVLTIFLPLETRRVEEV